MYQSGRSSDSRIGRCQASIASRQRGASSSACRGQVECPLAGLAPLPRIALPPTPAGPELDDGEVPGDREAERPTLAGCQLDGGGDGSPEQLAGAARAAVDRRVRAGRRSRSRPTARWSARASKRSRTVTVTPGARDAATANVPRRPDGAPTGAWRIAPSTSWDRTVSCQAPASAGWRGSAAGSAQLSMIPTVRGSGPGFSTHHSKAPTGSALDTRSPAMTGLSCSPTSRTPSALGSNACHARGKRA